MDPDRALSSALGYAVTPATVMSKSPTSSPPGLQVGIDIDVDRFSI